jgi:hypothetical protein
VNGREIFMKMLPGILPGTGSKGGSPSCEERQPFGTACALEDTERNGWQGRHTGTWPGRSGIGEKPKLSVDPFLNVSEVPSFLGKFLSRFVPVSLKDRRDIDHDSRSSPRKDCVKAAWASSASEKAGLTVCAVHVVLG